jgi:hypothetical protein
MTNRKPRVLEEIKELLKSVDSKLDKLLDRQVMGDPRLNLQRELDRQRVKRDTSPYAFPGLFKGRLHFDRDAYERMEIRQQPQVAQSFVPGTFVSLPGHLRETMLAILTCGEATALRVSEKTGRSRAAESDYLNQLVDRGFLKKERSGREIVFQVFSLHTLCPMCGRRIPLSVKFCSFCGAQLYKREQPL